MTAFCRRRNDSYYSKCAHVYQRYYEKFLIKDDIISIDCECRANEKRGGVTRTIVFGVKDETKIATCANCNASFLWKSDTNEFIRIRETPTDLQEVVIDLSESSWLEQAIGVWNRERCGIEKVNIIEKNGNIQTTNFIPFHIWIKWHCAESKGKYYHSVIKHLNSKR
jgi:hypothetical protein